MTAAPVTAAAAAGLIPLISPTASSSALSDASKFPSFFRTNSPDAAQAQAMVDIAASLIGPTGTIKTASIISDVSLYSQDFAANIASLLPAASIELVTLESVGSEDDVGILNTLSKSAVAPAMGSIVEAGADVIFNVMRECSSSKVMQEAAMEAGGSGLLWIDTAANTRASCLPEGFDGSIFAPSVREGTGPVHDVLVRLWEERAEATCDGGPLIVYDEDSFDAVLAIAVAIRSILDAGESVSGEAIAATWSDPDFVFEGSTGTVEFGGDGSAAYGPHDRVIPYDIIWVVNGTISTIGTWNAGDGVTFLDEP